MSTKTLIYFGARGRGEIIRLIFAAVNEKFEDKRVGADWPEVKPTVKYGLLPALRLEDGTELNESLAIARYLARVNKLYGYTDYEMYLVDRAIDTINDLFLKVINVLYERDETKKDLLKVELKEKHIPSYLGNLTKYIEESGSDFLAGQNATVADIVLMVILDIVPHWKSLYPKLDNSYKKTIEAFPGIKAYLESRPSDSMIIS